MKVFCKILIVTSFMCYVGNSALGDTYTWTGAGGSAWESAGNWNPTDGPPSDGDSAMILNGGTVNLSSTVSVASIYIGNTTGNGTLNITHPDANFTTTTATENTFVVGSGGWGNVYQSTGTVSCGSKLQIGHRSTGGGGYYYIWGGTLTAADAIRVGDTATSGEMRVSGADASISCGSYFQLAQNGKLTANIDPEEGISTIQVDGYGYFSSGALLDVSFIGETTTPGTWTLLNWTGTTYGADTLAFSSSVTDPNWSFNVDTTNGALTVTYIPEPATLFLFAGGGMVMFVRRQKF